MLAQPAGTGQTLACGGVEGRTGRLQKADHAFGSDIPVLEGTCRALHPSANQTHRRTSAEIGESEAAHDPRHLDPAVGQEHTAAQGVVGSGNNQAIPK